MLAHAGCRPLESIVVGFGRDGLMKPKSGMTGYPTTISFRSDRTSVTLAGDHFQADWQVEHNSVSQKHRTVISVPIEDS